MDEAKIKITDKCRVCGSENLSSILSLGELHVSDFLDAADMDMAEKAPLELVLCEESSGGCGLLQLKHTVPNETLYRNYWYRSGMNKTMTDELVGIAKKVESLVDFKSGDFVLDIGANDGTLLRGYSVPGINKIGFEPAKNLDKWNLDGTTKIIPEFFNHNDWQKEFGETKAKAITAIAMFYDLEEPNEFIADIVKSLHKDGVFIIQMSYLPLMLSQNAFDNICHEHLEYYSLLSLENLLRRHNLEVFDVELNDVNGGSFRIYIKHKDGGGGINVSKKAERRLDYLRNRERELELNKRGIYDEFAERIYKIKDSVSNFIKGEVQKGKKIHVYGASTKGNTLLQYFNLDNTLIKAAAERNADKWGRKTVGTLIPIISEEQARSEKPDYFLILPWHFIKEFREREADYLKNGGKFIVPLPEFLIIEENN
ncbi:MAG: class I SAM-dependent methyltransferase [Candidatus Wolfebacteria bacterium]|nr:class I SAM-dependent methyltransferase [Candidatus Wolfebacteria bacterium]